MRAGGALGPETYDIAVVGAGLVGCAVARRLTLDGARVLVLEKSADVLDGASKGNSAILHTGFDAPPDSLERSCIAAGRAEYLDAAAELSLPVLESGAVVVAWTEAELGRLPGLLDKAHLNGVADARMLSRREILRREPGLSDRLLGGFVVPGEALVDPWATAHAYILQAMANDAVLRRGVEVEGGRYDGGAWELATTAGGFRARAVVGCAGLYGDLLDEVLAGGRDFTITPRKGQFLVFDKAASGLVSSIVLPVPTARTKGVVLCRTVYGNVLVGPTAEDQESRTDSSTDRRTLEGLRDRAVAMLPGLSACGVTAAYAGLRPATEHADYRIRHYPDRGYVSVGGIRSTGLSAALGIAGHVAGLLEGTGRRLKPLARPAVPPPDRLSEYHGRDWQEPGNGGVVCHCEMVTRREIEAVLDGPMPPGTMQGLKRRTRAAMGRCQGFYCAGELAEIAGGRLGDGPGGG